MNEHKQRAGAGQGLARCVEGIEELLAERGRVVVAIDGRCGSGKTTLAAQLADHYGAERLQTIHMDDFFLPAALRTPQRLEEPGGNVHYERFLTEVVPGLAGVRPFSHRVFDCSVMDYSGERAFGDLPITLVEGSYSQHPRFDGLYDLKIFTTCSPGIQADRLLARVGPALYQRFEETWIPMENRYFEAHHILQRCNLVLDTGEQPLL